MQDGDKDGVYTCSTDVDPRRRLRGKVAHGLQLGRELRRRRRARRRATTPSPRPTGKLVEFRYTLATHVLEIVVTDPPLAGIGESRAPLGERGHARLAGRAARRGTAADADVDAASTRPTATLAVADGAVTGGGEAVELALDPAGLTDAQLAKFPALAGYRRAATRSGSTARRSQQLLTEQLAVAQRDATAR